jgi:hypothetical protein
MRCHDGWRCTGINCENCSKSICEWRISGSTSGCPS